MRSRRPGGTVGSIGGGDERRLGDRGYSGPVGPHTERTETKTEPGGPAEVLPLVSPLAPER